MSRRWRRILAKLRIRRGFRSFCARNPRPRGLSGEAVEEVSPESPGRLALLFEVVHSRESDGTSLWIGPECHEVTWL